MCQNLDKLFTDEICRKACTSFKSEINCDSTQKTSDQSELCSLFKAYMHGSCTLQDISTQFQSSCPCKEDKKEKSRFPNIDCYTQGLGKFKCVSETKADTHESAFTKQHFHDSYAIANRGL